MSFLSQIHEKNQLEAEENQRLFVCPACVSDEFLRMRAELKHLKRERICSGCGREVAVAISASEIAVPLRPVLPQHFDVSGNDDGNGALTLEDLLEQTMRFGRPEIARAVAAELIGDEEGRSGFYRRGLIYQAKPSAFSSTDAEQTAMLKEWERIAFDLTHGRRFFNDEAFDFLTSLLDEALGVMRPEVSDAACIRRVATGEKFFRARIAADDDAVGKFLGDPAKELGAPPLILAASNRMSPAGISLLYLAKELATCVAEVRPSIGDQVVIAEFAADDELTFFDFTALQGTPIYRWMSILDPLFKRRSKSRALLRCLQEAISRPARSSDVDYVLTQAFAEVIRSYEGRRFDGVVFNSVQKKPGTNFVVFDKRSFERAVEEDSVPEFGMSVRNGSAREIRITEIEYDWSPPEPGESPLTP